MTELSIDIQKAFAGKDFTIAELDRTISLAEKEK